MCAYLFEYDSVFGPWKGSVALDNGALVIDGRRVPLHRTPDLSSLDLTGVDLVMECTGRAEGREVAERGLRAGAARVLVSGPSQAAEVTVVLGANDAVLGGQKIVSNASCTTNALAPLAKLIHENWGIVTGSMTTVHCYTGSQPTVDAPAADYPRSRAAALSMVPTTTSAARLLGRGAAGAGGADRRAGGAGAGGERVLRGLPSGDFETAASVEEVNAAFRAAGGVIGATDRPLVSTDLRARPESVVMACPETKVSAGGMLRVFGWYDNEWGFSNRMLDMAPADGVRCPRWTKSRFSFQIKFLSAGVKEFASFARRSGAWADSA
jgi:glyceraldehyde 3-phosphate dehydrogenase